jgi:hypothetical protein
LPSNEIMRACTRCVDLVWEACEGHRPVRVTVQRAERLPEIQLSITNSCRFPSRTRPTAVTHKSGVRSLFPLLNHATSKHRGQILVRPCSESRIERTRQIGLGAATVTERIDEDDTNQARILGGAVLWAFDSLGRVCENLVPRLFAGEGRAAGRGGEDDRDDSPVSTWFHSKEYLTIIMRYQSQGKTPREHRYRRTTFRQQRFGLPLRLVLGTF